MNSRNSTFAVVASLMTMFSIGSLYAWSVFVAPLEVHLQLSRSMVSGVFSLAIVSFTSTMLFGPSLYRHASAPRLGLLIGAIAASGLFLAGAASNSLIVLLLGFGLLFGAANGLGYGLSIQVIQAAVIRRRGLLSGMAVACYTLGSAVFSGLFSWSISRFGVASTFMAAGLYMVVTFIGVFWLLRLSGVSVAKAAPQAATLDQFYLDRSFWTLWFGFLTSAFAGVMILGHAAPVVGAAGGGSQAMAMGAALVAIGNGAGRLTGGWISDGERPRQFLSALLFLSAIALLVLLIWPVPIVAITALGVMGIGYGSVAGAFPAIVARLYGARNVSRVYGRIFTAWGVAGLGGPLVGGLLFDQTGDYRLAIALGIAAALCASLLCLSIRLPRSEPA